MGEGLLAFCQEQPASLRQGDLAGGAREELGSDFILEGLYQAAQGRLGDEECLRSLLEMQRFGDGNLYLNCAITGARVRVQPFGGLALSGTGVQAGGEDYLRQFVWSRVVSSNRLRHGYVPGIGH